jgi:hypothetical protein
VNHRDCRARISLAISFRHSEPACRRQAKRGVSSEVFGTDETHKLLKRVPAEGAGPRPVEITGD